MTESQSRHDTRCAVLAHLEAFNQHSTDRLLDGLSEDAIWATGRDVVKGRAELADLFAEALWELEPSLSVLGLVVDGNSAAAQLREELTLDGERRSFDIAVFFEVSGALISTAKVYREGSADIE